jgi:[ribosomal protein S5]-alanine N-acetyltransferase
VNEVERLACARAPRKWPGRALIERAFCASLERIRSNPEERLWGDRLIITREGERRLVGSVIFHGRPDSDGVVEMAYGVEQESQGCGYATEATRAALEWALAQECVRAVTAATFPWHTASVRVLEKLGMRAVSTREHEILGDLVVYERRCAE